MRPIPRPAALALLAACSVLGTADTPAAAEPQSTRGGSNLTAPMQTPSGARSPSRRKVVRKGTVTRSAPRSPAPVAPASTSAPGASSPATAAPDPEALARTLSLPDNADFRAWCESSHDFDPPRPQRSLMPFSEWEDDSNCLIRREGDTRFVKAGCTPAVIQVRVAVDRAYGEALEAQFGFPAFALEPIRCTVDDGGCVAVEAAVAHTAAMHGIVCTPDRVVPDHQWIMDRSVDEVRPVAEAVIRATFGAGSPTNPRQRVEALTSFVQNAVPYRPIKGTRDDLIKDGKTRCGLRTPIATLFEGGDCDSKSLLLAALIRGVEPSMPLALVYCADGETPHMVLAAGCPRNGDEASIQADGRALAVIETTSDWDIGHLGSGIDLAEAEVVGLR
jgi:hypothetical protein